MALRVVAGAWSHLLLYWWYMVAPAWGVLAGTSMAPAQGFAHLAIIVTRLSGLLLQRAPTCQEAGSEPTGRAHTRTGGRTNGLLWPARRAMASSGGLHLPPSSKAALAAPALQPG